MDFQNYADWTQESTCKTLTSCSCGILNNHKWLTDKVKNKINSFHKFQYASIWNNYGWPEQKLGENRRKISRRQKRGIIFHFIVKHEEIIKDFHMSLLFVYSKDFPTPQIETSRGERPAFITV